MTIVLPPGFLTTIASGTASCVWPPSTASMPRTREASLRSTSMPLCERRTTICAPFARAASTCFWSASSWMPKVHSGTKWRGLAIGVYGNAWPTIATGTPLISCSTQGANTGSPKSWVLTFCATNSIRPSSFATASRTRSAP